MIQARTCCAIMGMVILPQLALAQTLTGAVRWADSARREIDAAVIQGDAGRLNDARTLLDRALVAFPDDALLLHYQGYATYRSMNIAAAAVSAQAAASLMKSAREILERSIAKKPMPESYVLLSSVLGREIGLDPSQGQVLGMRIQELSGMAKGAGPGNPRVFLVLGQGALYSPPEYGGGAEVAQKLLSQAIVLFASDRPSPAMPDWGRAEAYAWLGQSYEKLGRRVDALNAYKAALDLEPNYSWVKRVLIPALEKSGS